MKEQLIFPTPDEMALIISAQHLINQYAKEGMMLSVMFDKLLSIAAQGMLGLLYQESEVIATAAISFQFPNGHNEFGAWAVQPPLVKHGYGKTIMGALFSQIGPNRNYIAFGNENSAPIFKKLGAVPYDHDTFYALEPEAFAPCATCLCHGKELFGKGKRCADEIFDLRPVITKILYQR